MSKEDKDKSLEDLLKEEGYGEDSYDYEDAYVYGDSDELDESFYGEMDLEDYDEYYDEYDDPYANPREDKQVRGRYSHLIEDEEGNNEPEEEPKLTLQQKVAKYTNKTLDFVESKKFNTMQWLVALGALIIVGVVIYLIMQAGTNLGSNVEYQEQERAEFVARKIASEEYDMQEKKVDKNQQIMEVNQENTDKQVESYWEQKEKLGKLTEGHIELQDADGELSYVTEEEYYSWQDQDVRENTTALPDGETTTDSLVNDMDIEIMPASEVTWNNNVFEPKGTISDEELYQTRGQYIYFAQKAIPFLFANQILASDFDTNTYTLTIIKSADASFPLPDDFEDRMHYTYQNSGYQAVAPDALTIEYEEMTLDEYSSTLE